MHTKPILAYHSYISICLYLNFFFLDVIMQKKMLGGGFMIITFPVKFYEMSQKNKSGEPRAMS